MDEATAHWLVSDEAAEPLAAAMAEPDPASLAAAARMRNLVPPDRAAAALSQAGLRRRGRQKFGDRAASMFFTRDGLEQATRPGVAAWRAARFLAAGVAGIHDLCCGIGADALAFAAAGLRVVAIERDPVTAVLGRANLAGTSAVVRRADAIEVAAGLGQETAVFCDPARRTPRGRSWRLEDLSPSWEFAHSLLGRPGPTCIKLGPGLAAADAPDVSEAVWVSDGGELVEASLWAGTGWETAAAAGIPGGVPRPGARRALLLPVGETVRAWAPDRRVAVRNLWDYLLEPDPAVIRAGALARVAHRFNAGAVDASIAYLTCDRPVSSPLVTCYRVLESLPYEQKALRAWVREHGVGVLEIKKRGVDIDPADLRRQLRPAGGASATLVLTPTRKGARALVVQRLGQEVGEVTGSSSSTSST